MRRASALPVLLLLAFLPGCKGTYHAEKDLWQIRKDHYRMIADPAKASPPEFARLVAEYRALIKYYPAWAESSRIQYSIADMLSQRGEYADARNEFGKVLDMPNASDDICSRAMFRIGEQYEKESNWPAALRTYEVLQSSYAMTSTGLRVPLIISRHYRQAGMPAESRRSLEKAEKIYKQLIDSDPSNANVAFWENLLVSAYGGLGEWNEAVKELKRISEKYFRTEAAAGALFQMSLIYREYLNEPGIALALCERILREYPADSPVRRDAQYEIADLMFEHGDIAGSRSEMLQILDKYRSNIALCAVAQLGIAVAYEKEGNWDKALFEYNKLNLKYPDSLQAMQAMLLVAKHYMDENEMQLAERSFDKAVDKFGMFVKVFPDRPAAAVAQEYIGIAYALQEKWVDAIAAFDMLRSRYPSSGRAPLAVYRMAEIFRLKIKDSGKAASLYSQFVRDYPDHELAEKARAILRNLNS